LLILQDTTQLYAVAALRPAPDRPVAAFDGSWPFLQLPQPRRGGSTPKRNAGANGRTAEVSPKERSRGSDAGQRYVRVMCSSDENRDVWDCRVVLQALYIFALVPFFFTPPILYAPVHHLLCLLKISLV